METFKVIAFTHKNLPLELIGLLHLSHDQQKVQLKNLQNHFQFEELLFLSTCNRVELFLKTHLHLSQDLIHEICIQLNHSISPENSLLLSERAEVFHSEAAVAHMHRVTSSLDSLVVGEREIITQVRKAYDFCNELGLTGDFMRLLVKQTIETAKQIYTDTNIAKNPVSVASLAYRQLRQLGIKNEARIIFVGSGETNTILANYFQKHKFANFTVFNRTLSNAATLASKLGGRAYDLNELHKFNEGFDVLVVCTSSSKTVITEEIYQTLNGESTSKKVIIDLGVPANVHTGVANKSNITYIDINSLKKQAEENLQLRKNEIVRCEAIIAERAAEFQSLYAERKVELAFGEIPKQVKAIKDFALNEVFAKDINALDLQSKEVLEKVVGYMEKKYNAMAIKTAKEVFLTNKE